MAKTVNKTVKTLPGELVWCTLKGEGKNTAMPGQPERMQYIANLRVPENGEVHQDIEAKIWEVWEEYKQVNGVKGKPAKNDKGEYMIGIHKEYQDDPNGEIDPDTEKVRKVPTGNVIITFKTGVAWPDGSPKVVEILNGRGKELTEKYQRAKWTIGNGTIGVIHGVASGNDIGGKHKISLYLNGVQLIDNLVKYTGSQIDADVYEDAPDIDIDDEADEYTDEGSTPTEQTTTEAPAKPTI